MDNKSYLDSITVSAPAEPQRFDKKFTKIIKILGLISFITIIFIVIVSVFNSLAKKPQDFIDKINLSSTSLTSTIDKYSPSLKSPGLRRINASLRTTLVELSANISQIKLPQKSKNQKSKTDPSLTTNFKNLDTALDDALLRGRLDRAYQQHILYQISLLNSELKEIKDYQKSFNKDSLDSITNIQNSLKSIHTDLTSFSDPSI